MPKMIVTWACEVCGSVYEDRGAAELCGSIERLHAAEADAARMRAALEAIVELPDVRSDEAVSVARAALASPAPPAPGEDTRRAK